jgi:hypothetical protein
MQQKQYGSKPKETLRPDSVPQPFSSLIADYDGLVPD